MAGDGRNNPVPQPNHWVGDPEATDAMAFLNAQFPVGSAGTSFVYAFGGWSAPRRPGPRLLPPRPAGAELAADLPARLPAHDPDRRHRRRGHPRRARRDGGLVLGPVRDLRREQHGLQHRGQLNTSLGPNVPPNHSEFYAGSIAADQLVANADVSRRSTWASRAR